MGCGDSGYIDIIFVFSLQADLPGFISRSVLKPGGVKAGARLQKRAHRRRFAGKLAMQQKGRIDDIPQVLYNTDERTPR